MTISLSTLRIENHPYSFSLRPYHVEKTGSRLITKVKLRRAELVLGRGTTWEHSTSFCYFEQKNYYVSRLN
ncbi:hypothetical protein DERF_012285 [Dermatophagoides farinae]|uniref:Uncharacterized protein n=1 Tax=Dermatophagoides farinae TaxID=6954 RepID=A0A922KY52_DERFA|nr:hypothetical protein DERF_012285 [Dermatophagoides farinae]